MRDKPTLTRWKPREAPTKEFFIAQLQQEGCESYEYSFQPGEYYPNHSHATREIRILLSGSMIFGVPDHDMEVRLGPGDRLDLPAKTVHWARVDGDEVVHTLCGH